MIKSEHLIFHLVPVRESNQLQIFQRKGKEYYGEAHFHHQEVTAYFQHLAIDYCFYLFPFKQLILIMILLLLNYEITVMEYSK